MYPENYFEKWLYDMLARQGAKYSNTLINRIRLFLTGQFLYLTGIGRGNWNYLLIVSRETTYKSEYLQSFRNSVECNSTYNIHRDSVYFYIFIKDDEDLNFLRLIINEEHYALFDLKELNEKIKSS